MVYFKKKNLVELVRISIHSYNTINEINYLIKCLIDLIKKISNYRVMKIEKFIRLIQIFAVLLILTGAVIGFLSEVYLMFNKNEGRASGSLASFYLC